MLASVDDAVAALQRASRTRESGQHGLFEPLLRADAVRIA